LRAGVLAAAVIAAAAAEGAGSQQVIAAAAVVVWWSVIVALAAGRLLEHRWASVPPAAIIAGGCLVGIAALSFLSLAWASDDGRAFAIAVQAALYAGVFVLVVLLSSPGDGRSWLGGLALGLAAVCAVALTARLVPGIDADAGLFEAIPSAQGRLSFPLGYWNGLGALAALALIVLSWVGARGRGRVERAVATAAIPLACLTLYLTSSRGAIAAAAVGMVALVALGPARARIVGTAAIGVTAGGVLAVLAATRSDLRDGLSTSTADSQGLEMLVATLGAIALVGVVRYALDAPLAGARIPRLAGAVAVSVGALALIAGVATADPGGWIEEFRQPPDELAPQDPEATRDLVSASGHGRWQFWQAAGNAFREEPLTGVGAGGFEAFWNQHGTLAAVIEHAHSIFLQYLAELGPLGLLLIVGALAVAVVCAVRRRRATLDGEAAVAGALVLAATLAFAIDWSWSIPAVALPVLVALAVATGPSTVSPLGAMAASEGRPGRLSGAGLATVTILLAWGAIWVGGISLLTAIKVDQSQAAAARGDLEDAAADADDAITLQPWAAEPRLQLGLVYELAGDLDAARERVIEATERAPEDWRVWFILSRVEGTQGNVEAAREALNRADGLLPSTHNLVSDDG
jgi:tetratricopeptide (TPR) repeat protein